MVIISKRLTKILKRKEDRMNNMTPEQAEKYNGFIVKQWREIKTLEKKELLHLLASYDEYVRQIIEENDSKPVCLAEFYYYDYLDYFNDWESDLLKGE